MKILFYLGHPAHFHLFKNSIKILMSENEVYIVAKEKDILINLIKNENWTYYNILDKKRKDVHFKSIWSHQIDHTVAEYNPGTGIFVEKFKTGEIKEQGKVVKSTQYLGDYVKDGRWVELNENGQQIVILTQFVKKT